MGCGCAGSQVNAWHPCSLTVRLDFRSKWKYDVKVVEKILSLSAIRNER